MDKQITLRESVTAAPVKTGNRWRVIVARPGQGSSGNYSAEMFRRDAEKLIAPGGQAFINHGSDRNPKDMLGVYPEGAFWDESENAVVAELDVFSHWKAFVEEVGPHCGISLYAMGEADEDGNVTAILEDRLNGADLVARPGLVGSGLAAKLYESATERDSEETSAKAEEKENTMEIQDLVTAIEALTGKIDSLVSEQEADKAEKIQAEADAKAVEAAVDAYAEAAKAVAEADLLPSQAEAILTEARKGADVEKAISEAKVVKEEALASVELKETAPGRSFGERKFESAADLGKVFG